MNKTIISLTGELGSGKSVVAKLLAEKLNFKKYATGEIQRKLAAQKGMNVLEMNKYAEAHREIDDAIDSYTINLGKKENNFVIDSRMAWHFIPTSFKVYLFVSEGIAGMRIKKDSKRKSENYNNTSEATQSIQLRRKSERKRFSTLYNVDVFSLNNYSLVIDTSYILVKEVVNCIIAQYKIWLKKSNYGLHAYVPKAIFNFLLSNFNLNETPLLNASKSKNTSSAANHSSNLHKPTNSEKKIKRSIKFSPNEPIVLDTVHLTQAHQAILAEEALIQNKKTLPKNHKPSFNKEMFLFNI